MWSLYAIFEEERLYKKAVLRNRVVERTAKACGIGTTLVKKIHQKLGFFTGTLESPEKHYDETRTRIMLNEFNVEAIRILI